MLIYRHFLGVIEKAKEACKNSGNQIGDHFEDILDMIVIGKGGRRQVENVRLSRYACYLIVQNADPSKEIIAIGQTYFAVLTRLQEISKMQEFTRLTDENEKRLFLRNEELGGTMPENLPVEENIKKIEQSKQKKLPKP